MTKKSCDREDEVRKVIVDKARQLFDRFGPTKTTIADIARASGISPAHIYNFFDGKNDIIEAVADNIFSQYSDEITEQINKYSSPHEKIVCIFMMIYQHNRQHALPADEALQIKLSEGIDGWRYEHKFQGFVLRTVQDILVKAAASAGITAEQIRKDSRAILDCMFFGAVYSDRFRSIPADEYECRVRGQLDLIRSALLGRGYVIG